MKWIIAILVIIVAYAIYTDNMKRWWKKKTQKDCGESSKTDKERQSNKKDYSWKAKTTKHS